MTGIMTKLGGLLPALGLQAAVILYKTQRVKMSVSKDRCSHQMTRRNGSRLTLVKRQMKIITENAEIAS